MGQYVVTWFYMLLDWEVHIEQYYERIVSSHMLIFVDKLIYSKRNVQFSKVYKFSYNESDL